MKKILKNRLLSAVILILCYLILMAICLLALCIYPVQKQRTQGTATASRIAASYAQGKPTDINRISGAFTHILIYNTDGECIQFSEKGFHPAADFDPFLQPYLEEVLQGKDISHLTRSFFSSNITHLWMLSGTPVIEDDRITGAVFVIDSISSLQEALIGNMIFFTISYWLVVFFWIRTLKKQERLDQLRQDYIDNVTHELKAPIASTKILIESLSDNTKEEADPDRRQVYYGMALKEINQQSHMVNEILELSRLQNLQKKPACSDFTFTELFLPVLDTYRMMCDCIGISFSEPEDTDALPALYTNKSISQVLENLLSNAVSYCEEGDSIAVSAQAEGKILIVSVTDTGPGIDAEDQKRIFERFFRSKTAPRSGTGLGLSICQAITDSLGENIQVISTPGKGSTFSFTIHLSQK